MVSLLCNFDAILQSRVYAPIAHVDCDETLVLGYPVAEVVVWSSRELQTTTMGVAGHEGIA